MQRYNKFLCRPKTEKINYKFPKQRFGFLILCFARLKSSFIFLKARVRLVFLYFGGFSFYFGFRLLAFGFCPSSVDCCPLSFSKNKTSVRKCKSRSNARFSLLWLLAVGYLQNSAFHCSKYLTSFG